MAKPANPINQGFRAVLRDPALLLIEVLWRWSFGGVAFLLLFFPTLTLVGSLNISQEDSAAWRSNNPTLMAQAMVKVLIESGPQILRLAAWVLPLVTLLWIAFGAAGRAATIGRLGKGSARFRTILALQCTRALLTWAAFAGLIAALWFDATVSTHGAQQDLFLYYALAVWSLILAGGAWVVGNWYLSLAPLCGLGADAGFLASTWKAVRLGRRHSGDLGGTSLIFALLRLVALAVAFVLWALPSGFMSTAPRTYAAWVVAVSLAYFAISDFLYLARMVAYFRILSPEGALTIEGAGSAWPPHEEPAIS